MTRLNNDHCTFFSMQVLSIISPERYIEQLLEEQNQGTFSVCMANGIPENDVRLYFHINQLGKPELLNCTEFSTQYNGCAHLEQC